MRKQNGRYVYAASDLIEFMQSPFATWMTRFSLEFPQDVRPDDDPPGLTLLFDKGQQHEHSVLSQLSLEQHDIYLVPPTGNRRESTRKAMQAGRAVIFQGALASDPFVGDADFLVRVGGTSALGDYYYEVWEAKLSRTVKPEFLVQLCCYADLLEAVQGRRPDMVRIVLGNGERQAFRTEDYFYFYQALKAAFLAFLARFNPHRQPVPDPADNHGRWTSHAAALLEASDHLFQVAHITPQQIRKLQDAGIGTMTALAETQLSHIPKMEDALFLRLREQAHLQVASRGAPRPQYRIIPPVPPESRRGLALLPPQSPLDVYFDLEGYPLGEGNLEYLFGVTHLEHDEPQFRDWWAHDAEEEKRAFCDFVDWVYARWRADPAMHIYHYGAYEVTAMRALMGRYGTRETEVDTLLRHEVFVDLYTIVRQGLRVGEPRYSLKNLEHLYREQRAGTVTTASDSLVYYERWLESGEPRDWQTSPLLCAIRDYNRDDCESTWQLTQWLRARQREAGIAWIPPRAAPPEDHERQEDTPESAGIARRKLAESLLAAIPQSERERAADNARWHIQELLGHLLEFHRREAKPIWWSMFDRHTRTEEELVEDLDCLGGLRRLPSPPVKIKQSLGFWYTFDPDQDTKLSPGSSCFLAHDLTMKTEIHSLEREQGRVCLKFGPAKLRQMAEGGPPEQLALIPDEYVSAEVIAQSISSTALAWRDTHRVPAALEDVLLRRPPRIRGYTGGPLLSPGEDVEAAAVRLAAALDHSSLCIQGPPGTGKTTLAANMILALVAQGKRVGITSNSHAAIVNLMSRCSEARGGRLDCLKVGGSAEDPFFSTCAGAEYVRSAREALPKLAHKQVIGGSAWVFSAEGMRDKLDYLFVDEAGQVSIANLVGMAPASKNLVLIGDQMQLGQPIQGSHPGQSGLSILDYLLQGQATIPADLGLFLGTTWRLHPALCDFLSAAVYNGRLRPAPQTANRIVRKPTSGVQRVTKEAGILFVPVAHEGNTQGSDEEVAVIRELVDELVGRELTDDMGRVAGRLRLEDILFVAPYNMQVRKLKAAVGPWARVGSVDKFQGQEAPVVIVSMCASQGDVSPRGIEFLFNQNRLNVALSRARSLAIVVANPALAHTRCSSVSQMASVNLFCRIMHAGKDC